MKTLLDKKEDAVATVIRELGVPCHVKGYQYICEAVRIALDDEEAIYLITKMIYPQVARAFGSTPSRVERAMRHAKRVAWDRENEAIQKIFFRSRGAARKCPTNAEFIAFIRNYIMRYNG